MRTGISFGRWANGADQYTAYGDLNLAINVTSFFSATSGFCRRIYKEAPNKVTFGVLMAKNVLDVLCDVFAGLASVGQVIYETAYPPSIVAPDVTNGQQYAADPGQGGRELFLGAAEVARWVCAFHLDLACGMPTRRPRASRARCPRG